MLVHRLTFMSLCRCRSFHFNLIVCCFTHSGFLISVCLNTPDALWFPSHLFLLLHFCLKTKWHTVLLSHQSGLVSNLMSTFIKSLKIHKIYRSTKYIFISRVQCSLHFLLFFLPYHFLWFFKEYSFTTNILLKHKKFIAHTETYILYIYYVMIITQDQCTNYTGRIIKIQILDLFTHLQHILLAFSCECRHVFLIYPLLNQILYSVNP